MENPIWKIIWKIQYGKIGLCQKYFLLECFFIEDYILQTDSDMLGVIIKLASEEKFEINSLDGLTDDPGKQLLFKEFVAVDDVKRKRLEMVLILNCVNY